MTSPIPSVIDQQRRWAKSQGLETTNAFLESLADNLRAELSTGALADFKRGSGRELRDRGIKPPRMQALRSSAALSATSTCCSAWRTISTSPLRAGSPSG